MTTICLQLQGFFRMHILREISGPKGINVLQPLCRNGRVLQKQTKPPNTRVFPISEPRQILTAPILPGSALSSQIKCLTQRPCLQTISLPQNESWDFFTRNPRVQELVYVDTDGAEDTGEILFSYTPQRGLRQIT